MKKRTTLSTPSKYIINAVLVAALLAGGALLYNSVPLCLCWASRA